MGKIDHCFEMPHNVLWWIEHIEEVTKVTGSKVVGSDLALQALNQLKICQAENEQRNQWQPIETAPKDGTKVLSFNGNGGGYNGMAGEGEAKGDIAVVYWDGDKWMLPHCCDGVSYNIPTHWMPLPGAPKEESQ